MTGDFSRNSQNPTKSYAGVLMQQGRVQVDADWNEQLALAQHRTTTETVDVIGESGTPMGADGFGLSLTPAKDDFFIHPGRYYIGGLLCEIDPEWVAVSVTVSGTNGAATLSSSWLDGRPISQFDWIEIDAAGTRTFAQLDASPKPTTNNTSEPTELKLRNIKTGFPAAQATRLRRALTYTTQPFYPSPELNPGISSPPLEAPGRGLSLESGDYIVYLEAWQRSVNALEDPHIREVALDGPDTAERLQTVWQVRVLPVTVTDGADICQAHPSEWNSLLAAATTTAQMNAQAAPPPQTTNKCMLPPSAGFQGLQNQLYRIEILHGGSESEATYIWSRDNGMVETSIVSVNTSTPNLVTVNGLGTDDLHSFAINDWVEIVDRDDELSGTTRFLAQIVAPAPDLVSKQIALSRSVPEPYLDGINNPPNPTTNFYRLKRWDMSGAGVSSDGIQIKPDTWMPIEEGVQVKFSSGHYAPGAWWLIPARTTTADIEWPPFQVPNTEPIPQPPSGIDRSFCRLGSIVVEEGNWTFGDCRHFFPPLTALEGLYYVGGDGQEAMPGQPLAEPLQVRVANGGWPVSNVTVQFAFGNANVSGRFTSGDPSPNAFIAITVKTDTDGIAKCTWTLPSNWTPVSPTVPPSVPPPAYTVVATVIEPALQDSNGDSIYQPVIFSAEWNTADQVAFAPSGCITLGSCTTVQEALDTLCPPGLYYVGGDGQDARPGKQLPLPLQVSVATGSSPVASAKAQVTFALVAPSTGLLSATQGTPGTSATIQIPTDASGIASCYWTPDNLTANQQVMATLTGSTASPVYFNVNYDPGVHITNVVYQRNPYKQAASLANLTNNEVIPAYFFAGNAELQVACDGSLNAATITRGSCFVTLDWYYSYQFAFNQLESVNRGGVNLPGTFVTLVVDASLTLSPDRKTIVWQPSATAQQMIGGMASGLSILSYPPRVLARLAVKGNMILSDAAKPLHLDGDAFFDASGALTDSISGDGKRGGTYETYFWLAWNILVTFPNGQMAAPSDPVPIAWAANTKYAVGAVVLDSNGNVEQATTAGTSGPAAPKWPTTFSASTADGSTGLTWQSIYPSYQVSFGTCATITTQTIVVTNTSTAAVTINASMAPGSSGQFIVTSALTLPGGQSGPLVVTYRPAAATAAATTGTVIITTSDSSAPSVSVGVSGTPGSQANGILAVTPDTLNFATQPVGKVGASQTVTMAASNVAVSNISAQIVGPNAGDFSFDTPPATVAVGAKGGIVVTFTPSQTGPRAALLQINDSAGGSPQTVLLLGTGA